MNDRPIWMKLRRASSRAGIPSTSGPSARVMFSTAMRRLRPRRWNASRPSTAPKALVASNGSARASSPSAWRRRTSSLCRSGRSGVCPTSAPGAGVAGKAGAGGPACQSAWHAPGETTELEREQRDREVGRRERGGRREVVQGKGPFAKCAVERCLDWSEVERDGNVRGKAPGSGVSRGKFIFTISEGNTAFRRFPPNELQHIIGIPHERCPSRADQRMGCFAERFPRVPRQRRHGPPKPRGFFCRDQGTAIQGTLDHDDHVTHGGHHAVPRREGVPSGESVRRDLGHDAERASHAPL